MHNIPANSTCPGFGELYAKTLGQSCTYSIRLIKATCTRQHSVSEMFGGARWRRYSALHQLAHSFTPSSGGLLSTVGGAGGQDIPAWK